MRWLSETAEGSRRVVSCWRNEGALCRLPAIDRVASGGADIDEGLFEARAKQRPT